MLVLKSVIKKYFGNGFARRSLTGENHSCQLLKDCDGYAHYFESVQKAKTTDLFEQTLKEKYSVDSGCGYVHSKLFIHVKFWCKT